MGARHLFRDAQRESAWQKATPSRALGPGAAMHVFASIFSDATSCVDPVRLFAFRDAFQAARERFMHDRGYRLPRIHLLGTSVNRLRCSEEHILIGRCPYGK